MPLRLTVVPTRNIDGEQLGELIRTWAVGSLSGKVSVELARTKRDVRDALISDLIILDLSVAPEGEHNYDILARFPRYRDFMFLVSRTPIPRNVRWGAHRGLPLFPKQQTNQDIVDWLAQELPPDTLYQYTRGWWDKVRAFTKRRTLYVSCICLQISIYQCIKSPIGNFTQIVPVGREVRRFPNQLGTSKVGQM